MALYKFQLLVYYYITACVEPSLDTIDDRVMKKLKAAAEEELHVPWKALINTTEQRNICSIIITTVQCCKLDQSLADRAAEQSVVHQCPLPVERSGGGSGE